MTSRPILTYFLLRFFFLFALFSGQLKPRLPAWSLFYINSTFAKVLFNAADYKALIGAKSVEILWSKVLSFSSDVYSHLHYYI